MGDNSRSQTRQHPHNVADLTVVTVIKVEMEDPNHQLEKHDSEPANFRMQVLASYNDPLSRQASEAIHISKMNCEILNGKSEFHQPSIVEVKRSISRGL